MTKNDHTFTSFRTIDVTWRFMKALTWIAVFTAISISVMNITQLIVLDFIHGNPHRSQKNAAFMMAFYTPILSFLAFIGVFIIFAIPQLLQAKMANFLFGRFGRNGIYGSIIFVFILTVITWYFFDYFTPFDFNLGINGDPDLTLYRHGITSQRYLITLEIQASIAVFTLLYSYLDAKSHKKGKKLLILNLILCAIIFGLIAGHGMAMTQIQFL